jgi:hypothetical protein
LIDADISYSPTSVRSADFTSVTTTHVPAHSMEISSAVQLSISTKQFLLSTSPALQTGSSVTSSLNYELPVNKSTYQMNFSSSTSQELTSTSTNVRTSSNEWISSTRPSMQPSESRSVFTASNDEAFSTEQQSSTVTSSALLSSTAEVHFRTSETTSYAYNYLSSNSYTSVLSSEILPSQSSTLATGTLQRSTTLNSSVQAQPSTEWQTQGDWSLSQSTGVDSSTSPNEANVMQSSVALTEPTTSPAASTATTTNSYSHTFLSSTVAHINSSSTGSENAMTAPATTLSGTDLISTHSTLPALTERTVQAGSGSTQNLTQTPEPLTVTGSVAETVSSTHASEVFELVTHENTASMSVFVTTSSEPQNDFSMSTVTHISSKTTFSESTPSLTTGLSTSAAHTRFPLSSPDFSTIENVNTASLSSPTTIVTTGAESGASSATSLLISTTALVNVTLTSETHQNAAVSALYHSHGPMETSTISELEAGTTLPSATNSSSNLLSSIVYASAENTNATTSTLATSGGLSAETSKPEPLSSAPLTSVGRWTYAETQPSTSMTSRDFASTVYVTSSERTTNMEFSTLIYHQTESSSSIVSGTNSASPETISRTASPSKTGETTIDTTTITTHGTTIGTPRAQLVENMTSISLSGAFTTSEKSVTSFAEHQASNTAVITTIDHSSIQKSLSSSSNPLHVSEAYLRETSAAAVTAVAPTSRLPFNTVLGTNGTSLSETTAHETTTENAGKTTLPSYSTVVTSGKPVTNVTELPSVQLTTKVIQTSASSAHGTNFHPTAAVGAQSTSGQHVESATSSTQKTVSVSLLTSKLLSLAVNDVTTNSINGVTSPSMAAYGTTAFSSYPPVSATTPQLSSTATSSSSPSSLLQSLTNVVATSQHQQQTTSQSTVVARTTEDEKSLADTSKAIVVTSTPAPEVTSSISMLIKTQTSLTSSHPDSGE